MVEIVSWIGVAIIALFAVVGFLGVVATSLLSVFRAVRDRSSHHGQVSELRSEDHPQLESVLRAG